MERMVETGDQRGHLCVGCLRKWFQVSWGYGSGGVRDDLGQI